MRITVIGTGYLGAVHAACMADIGHEVLGVDVDQKKIKALSQGHPPFFEPGLTDVLSRNVNAGRLSFTTSLAEAAEFADVHFICVGTPQHPHSYATDLTHVNAVVDGLAPFLSRETLVIGKSTVPVGTASKIAARLVELAPAGAGVDLVWNPEFLREGFAVHDTLRPDRIVVGTQTASADAVMRTIYQPILEAGTPYITMDLPTAELVKVSANAFLATKISFINAIADVCDAAGADVVPLATALGLDDRIGSRFLSAGLGFGGGCLPKDIRALMARAKELGVDRSVAFLRDVDEINMRRRERVVQMASKLVGGSLRGRNVGVLGAAFKPDSDDVRDSPALYVAAAIKRRGARVRVHDPQALDNARAVCPDLDFTLDAPKACERADVVLHLTEWREYRELDPAELARMVNQPRLIDARNALPVDAWRTAGWTVRALGRPSALLNGHAHLEEGFTNVTRGIA
jgi:UDPglucose 6-dehydrogenase